MSDYGNMRLKCACPGMISDTSEYNIDGACVVALGRRAYVGTPVAVTGIVEGVKMVGTVNDDETPYGIVMRDQLTFVEVDDEGRIYVPEGEPLSIVSHGRVWCEAKDGYDPQFMDKLKIGGGVFDSAGAISTNWTFAGGKEKFDGVNIIEVQTLQNANIVQVAPPVILVESATIQSDTASPSIADNAVNLSVTVTPTNATDKTGKFSTDGDTIASVDPNTGVLTPKGVPGDVVVTWTANDASKTTATYNHTFEME